MTRATYAGGQRYAVTWTGDNSSSWNHLKLSVSMLLNLGMSGFAFAGTDVGGFIGAPSPELMTKWIQVAAFTPIFRAHSEKGTPRKELWVDGPTELAVRRQSIEQRYRLLPYLYALADENARTGAPLMRPLFYDFPEALETACNQPSVFMLGERLLIAPPPLMESKDSYALCLPAGVWYDYWTGEPVAPKTEAGVQSLSIKPWSDRVPVFVRAGAILPGQALTQSTSETPQGPLLLDVYPGEGCHGTIYADDGHSMAYTRQDYLRQQVHCSQGTYGWDIDFESREGTYHPWWHQVTVRVHHWQGQAQATLNGKRVANESVQDGVLSVTIADPVTKSRLSLKAKS
jgi:alpha-glucosidase